MHVLQVENNSDSKHMSLVSTTISRSGRYSLNGVRSAPGAPAVLGEYLPPVICSLHFSLYHYLTNSIDKRKIKPDAIPLRISDKLSERHLLIEGTSRMNVKLAAQVFSNSVANAISLAGGNGDFKTNKWKAVNIRIHSFIKGELKIPSVTLYETVETMEIDFRKLHGYNLSKITEVMQYLTDILWSKVNSQNLPKEVLQCF
ncbi:hypothetical protein ACI65C_006155 [Semiaphis heraclei]